MLTNSYIHLKNVRFHARHGVMPQERTTGGDFVVNLSVEVDLTRATQTDRVEDTVNYAVLYDILRQEMGVASNLIEHVAGRVARQVLQTFPRVHTVDVEIVKKNPPMGAECDGASVRMVFKRDD